MIAGHFGLAAAAKARAPSVPLWALMLATQWLDVMFVPLVLAKVEHFEPVPGSRGGYGEVIIHADYTHSLAGALFLSVLFGLLFLRSRGRGAAAVLACVAFSHWLLDLVEHRADMPILPGNSGELPRLGFGLWRFPPVSMATELALVVGGGLLYLRAAQVAAREAKCPARRAYIAGLVVVASGMATLALDVVGL